MTPGQCPADTATVSAIDPGLSLAGARVLLRAPGERDVTPLVDALAQSAVARWWAGYDETRVRGELLGDDPGFVIEVAGETAGWLGVAEETEPDYRHVGLDIFLSEAHHGRGYGAEALRLVIDHFAGLGHHRFTIDPAVANERAIRSY